MAKAWNLSWLFIVMLSVLPAACGPTPDDSGTDDQGQTEGQESPDDKYRKTSESSSPIHALDMKTIGPGQRISFPSYWFVPTEIRVTNFGGQSAEVNVWCGSNGALVWIDPKGGFKYFNWKCAGSAIWVWNKAQTESGIWIEAQTF